MQRDNERGTLPPWTCSTPLGHATSVPVVVSEALGFEKAGVTGSRLAVEPRASYCSHARMDSNSKVDPLQSEFNTPDKLRSHVYIYACNVQ